MNVLGRMLEMNDRMSLNASLNNRPDAQHVRVSQCQFGFLSLRPSRVKNRFRSDKPLLA